MAGKVQVQTRQLEGRPHWVVPTVMIREGTWSGSGGPVCYSGEVLERSVALWDGRPVVVFHPMMNGTPYAGCPEVFDKQRIGVLFGTTFEAGRLKTECWIDQERAKAVDVRVANAISKRTPVEVSTGVAVITNDERTPDGAIVAQALLPDHLAILPTGRGACSLDDGAGLLRNESVETVLHLPSMMFAR